MSISTREPSGKWKLWAKWLALIVAVYPVLYLSLKYRSVLNGAEWFLIALLIVALSKYRPVKQRFDLVIDGYPVRVTLYMNVLGQIWINWTSGADQGKSCIGKSYGVPIWLDHKINLKGKQFNLRIYAKRFPDGYMISNYGRGFDMAINYNAFCF